MRTREQIQCMCDGCNKIVAGFRVSADVITPQGPASIASITPPVGWVIAMVRPALATPGGQPDASMPAHELARATGCAVQAALCEKCQRKATLTREVPSDAPGVEPPPTEPDERAAERERERAEAEAAAERAEREAFERRRNGATPDGMRVDVDAVTR